MSPAGETYAKLMKSRYQKGNNNQEIFISKQPQAKLFIVFSFNDRCCWHCERCHNFEYRKSEYECGRCPEGMVRNHSAPHDCRLAPEIYLDYTNPWALGALLLAGTGLIMTTIAMGKPWLY